MNIALPSTKKLYIWIDSDAKNEETTKLQNELKQIGISFQTFDNHRDGETAIEKLDQNVRLCLVISGTLGKSLIPSIHVHENVVVILIFCGKPEDHLEWAKPFRKITRIINEPRILKRELTNFHQLSEDHGSIYYPDDENGLYHLKHLVMAGELEHTNDTIESIAEKIMKTYNDDNTTRKFEAFLDAVLRCLMYFLKREQNLHPFVEIIRSEFENDDRDEKISQRYLIDMLLNRSSRYLHTRIVSLLSKRNPIPMIQPSSNKNETKTRCISDAIHLWNFEKPMLLSFGVDEVQGKSTLLNEIFTCFFDDTTADKYFHETIDLDFGCNAATSRPVNIADVHGQISADLLQKISKMFSGFLIHVKAGSFSSKIDHIIKYLKLLNRDSCVTLIFRDSNSTHENAIKSLESKLLGVCSSIQMVHLPDVSDRSKRETKTKISKLRNLIFGQIALYKMPTEAEIRNIFKSTLSHSENELLEENQMFIDKIRASLIDGDEKFYPIYSKFKTMSQKKLEIAKRDPYKNNTHDSTIFKLHCDSYSAECAFEEIQGSSRTECGSGFESFFSLIKDSKYRMKALALLTMELETKRKQFGTNRNTEIFNQNLSIDVHWRNALICLKNLDESEKKIVLDAYCDFILHGNPFEIIDGDNFHMQTDRLQGVFELLPDKRIFVLTVVGPQNSGKSTLLNFLFGTSFEARNERCTKGMYGTLVDVSHVKRKDHQLALEYDYVLVIDTEGILSLEKGDDEYSKRLLLFSIAVSHLVIINKDDEIDETMKKMITICTQSLKYLETARITYPAIHIIMNKRTTLNPDSAKNFIRIIMDSLLENKLDNIIDLKEENIHELSNAFSREEITINNVKHAYLSINETFVVSTQILSRIFIDKSSEIIKQNDDRFCVPSKWIQYSGEVFAAIKRHPDIAKFKEIHERQELDKLRKLSKTDLQFMLSANQGKTMINQNKGKPSDKIAEWFDEKRKTINAQFQEKLVEHRKECQINDETYTRVSALFQVQINNRIRSWEVTTILTSKHYALDNMMITCENSIRTKLSTLTLKDCSTDQVLMRKYLENQILELIPDIGKTLNLEDLWNDAKVIVSHLWIVFNIDHLPTVDDLLEHSDFLKSLDNSHDKEVLVDNCLDRIRKRCLDMLEKIHSVVGKFEKNKCLITRTDLTTQRKFLDKEQLNKIYNEVINSPNLKRIRYQQGVRLMFLKLFEERYKNIVKEKNCLETVFSEIKSIFRTSNVDNPDTELIFAEKLQSCGSTVITEFDKELGVFYFHSSDDFRRLIYKCIVLSAIMYYYARQKNDLIKMKKEFHEKMNTLVDKFLPLFVVNDNQDQIHATNVMDYLSEQFVTIVKTKVEKLIEQILNSKKQILRKRSIIEALDRRATLDKTDSAWIIKYITQPFDTIVQEFDIRQNDVIEECRREAEAITTSNLEVANNLFKLMKNINDRLNQREASRINFVNELFTTTEQENYEKQSLSNKRKAMAQLLNQYFCGQEGVEKFTIDGKIYKVGATWSQIISTCVITEDVKALFISISSRWQNIEIAYPGKFLEKIIQSESSLMTGIKNQLTKIIQEKSLQTLQTYRDELKRCEAVCPCCKRLCDYSHGKFIRIGDKNNEHRCEYGHQIRGLAGTYFETTGEASLLQCDSISDDDIVKVEGRGITWKEFKATKKDWLFAESRLGIPEKDINKPIWNRIGKELCNHYSRKYNKEIKFVDKNSPTPINHFIFVLDHSGSMNEQARTRSGLGSTLSLNSINFDESNSEESWTCWNHLLRAVDVFIDTRKSLLSKKDQFTAIVFGNRAKTVFQQRPFDSISLAELDLPMEECGGGTSYKAALDEVLTVLNSLKQDPKISQLKQTVIFMSDGEPQDYGSDSIDLLSNHKESSINSSRNEPLIHRFWTMGLGDFNKGILQMINTRMGGRFVDIENADTLIDAFAQIAEVIPID